MDLSFFAPGSKLFFVYLKVNNYTTSEGGVKYIHTYTHTHTLTAKTEETGTKA